MELIHTLFPDKRVKIMDIEAHKTNAECEESDVKLTVLVPNFYSSSDIIKDLSNHTLYQSILIFNLKSESNKI